MADLPPLLTLVVVPPGYSMWMRWVRSMAAILIVEGVGIWYGSSALQWMGFIFLALMGYDFARKDRVTDPQTAADRLLEVYGVRGR